MSETNLYRCFDSDERLLYVGISMSALSRLEQHKRESQWISLVAKITIESFPSRQKALEAEALAIVKERPFYNKAGVNRQIEALQDREPTKAMNLLTTKDVAAMTGYTTRALEQWRYSGRGPKFISFSKRSVRYRLSDVNEWVEAHLVNSTTEASTKGLHE